MAGSKAIIGWFGLEDGRLPSPPKRPQTPRIVPAMTAAYALFERYERRIIFCSSASVNRGVMYFGQFQSNASISNSTPRSSGPS